MRRTKKGFIVLRESHNALEVIWKGVYILAVIGVVLIAPWMARKALEEIRNDNK
jgi:hypothetical protein